MGAVQAAAFITVLLLVLDVTRAAPVTLGQRHGGLCNRLPAGQRQGAGAAGPSGSNSTQQATFDWYQWPAGGRILTYAALQGRETVAKFACAERWVTRGLGLAPERHTYPCGDTNALKTLHLSASLPEQI